MLMSLIALISPRLLVYVVRMQVLACLLVLIMYAWERAYLGHSCCFLRSSGGRSLWCHLYDLVDQRLIGMKVELNRQTSCLD